MPRRWFSYSQPASARLALGLKGAHGAPSVSRLISPGHGSEAPRANPLSCLAASYMHISALRFTASGPNSAALQFLATPLEL